MDPYKGGTRKNGAIFQTTIDSGIAYLISLGKNKYHSMGLYK